MNPTITSIVTLAGVLIFCLPRRAALIPFVAVAPLIPPGQFLEFGPFHFYASRLLLVVLLTRVVVRSEYRFTKYNSIDRLVLCEFVCGTLAYVALRGTSEALVNRMGWMLDGLGIYFAVRWTLRDSATWCRVLSTLAFLCMVIAIPMLIEQRTDRNFFSLLGGVEPFTEIRDGRVRSQGPFGHPILAGVFGGALVPLIWSLGWFDRKKKLVRAIGISGAMVIVLTSSSSTPFMACVWGIVGLAAFSIRRNMRAVRWSIIAILGLLQCVMNNPVWAIVAKFKVFGGSTGYYRFWLMDNFIRRFPEWCLFGIKSTAVWGQGLWDVTVMYVRVGVDGGFVTFVLFIAVIVHCYKRVGRSVAAARGEWKTQRLVWSLGAALTAHLAAFFGVNYWDQNVVPWYMLLAAIAGCWEIFSVSEIRETRRLLENSIQRASAEELAVPALTAGAFLEPIC